MFRMLDREVHRFLLQTDRPYKDVKALAHKIRLSYASDGLTGDECSWLMQKLWTNWFNG